MASQAEESIASGEAQPTADAKSAVGNCIAKIPGHSASGSTGSSESCDVNSNKKSNQAASADSNVSQTLGASGDGAPGGASPTNRAAHKSTLVIAPLPSP